jgi:hypothetical protein
LGLFPSQVEKGLNMLETREWGIGQDTTGNDILCVRRKLGHGVFFFADRRGEKVKNGNEEVSMK